MGKRTRRSVLPALSVFFLAGGFYAGVAAAQTVNIGPASGAPGSTVSFSVTLSNGGNAIAATQNDITFDPNAPIAVATTGHCAITTANTCATDGDCPPLPSPFTGNEPCVNQNGPDCTAQAAGKGGFFTFLPNGCSGATCTGMRALIVAVNNTSEIPDGSTLYSCNVAISSGAIEGNQFALTGSNVSMGTTTFALVPGTANNGTITVTAPVVGFLVCDVAPATGDDMGQFGNASLNIADVKALFKAAQFGGSFLPAAGSARFSAMDAVTVDAPPTCGGNGSLNIADVKACFKRAQFAGQANFRRSAAGAGCTSAQQ